MHLKKWSQGFWGGMFVSLALFGVSYAGAWLGEALFVWYWAVSLIAGCGGAAVLVATIVDVGRNRNGW